MIKKILNLIVSWLKRVTYIRCSACKYWQGEETDWNVCTHKETNEDISE